MKRCKLLIIILITNYPTFSQTLKPIVRITPEDTLFCFTVQQTKIVAQKISRGIYCESIAEHLARENSYLLQISLSKDRVITLLQTKVTKQDSISWDNQQIISGLNDEVKTREKEIKTQRLKNRVVVLAFGVAFLLVVL